MLTKRQKQILDFIKKYSKKNSYSPSMEEIAEHLGVSSVATVHEHLENLKKKGYLDRQEHQPRSATIYNDRSNGLVEIPLLGVITAGEPIEPIENPEPIQVSKRMLSRSGRHYALKVQGDSMIGEGIFDGDTVIVREQNQINDGETAVAYLPDKNEATLKKIYRLKNKWKLQPANPTMKPFYEKNIEIKGRVTNILRKIK
ncbi:MAG: transcriptional repressor LexA [Patescibacteria group bacterium]|nr:transcriptional repressor LexA [Patescibacteria group bacterium]